MWNAKRNGCIPSILDKNTLMTEDWIFMDKDLIRDDCNCINKATCLAIIDLLNNYKLDEAMKLIDWLQ